MKLSTIMNKLTCLILILFWFIATANAQENPYSALKERLGNDFQEPKVLFPLEFDGMKIDEAKIDYKFPFQ